ncbi:type III secretion system chaperone [Castellaniella defragrans]|uniref:type III secretion system chaperone n=1 Tax=Castellaniella defragrans TaxID=75697 RepID=UPI0023F51429|nr:type III secretion system chaperone [Castellaniella defragrans]
MDIEETAAQILLELGPLSEAIDIVHQNAPGDWSLLVFETRRFDLTLDAAHGRLVLATPVGDPDPATWGETASALLAYNLLWPQTGGAYFAQEGTRGAIWLQMQVPVAGLRAAALDTLLQGLAGTADAWAETLAQPAPSAPSPQPPFPGHGLMA